MRDFTQNHITTKFVIFRDKHTWLPAYATGNN